MTFEQLFKKIPAEKRESAEAIIKIWMQEMKSGIKKWTNFDLINGFLWGMYCAGIISMDDKEDLYNILDQISRKEGD